MTHPAQPRFTSVRRHNGRPQRARAADREGDETTYVGRLDGHLTVALARRIFMCASDRRRDRSMIRHRRRSAGTGKPPARNSTDDSIDQAHRRNGVCGCSTAYEQPGHQPVAEPVSLWRGRQAGKGAGLLAAGSIGWITRPPHWIDRTRPVRSIGMRFIH